MPEATTQPKKPAAKTNRLGLEKAEYKGTKSTLCVGCGHDSITNHIITSFFDLGINPHEVAKMSGIGCSSKTPAYFLGKAHGFNSVHGRMPSVSTGAKLANRTLKMIAVSGDGDTASIGIGQFCHLIRRNLDMLYIVENNGVYGLTKGQFSATADKGSVQKYGAKNSFEQVDICELALTMGCSYVARSFSGDPKQLVPLIKGGLSHKGTAIIDCISPCITFNNHEGSSRSYNAVKSSNEPMHTIGYVEPQAEISVDYEPGSLTEIALADGSKLTLKKLEHTYDTSNRLKALDLIEENKENGHLLTGLFYVEPKSQDLCETMSLPTRPLCSMGESDLRPTKGTLDQLMTRYS